MIGEIFEDRTLFFLFSFAIFFFLIFIGIKPLAKLFWYKTILKDKEKARRFYEESGMAEGDARWLKKTGENWGNVLVWQGKFLFFTKKRKGSIL